MGKTTRQATIRSNKKTRFPLSMCLSPTSFKTLFWWLLLLGIMTLYIFLGLGSLPSPTLLANAAVNPSEAASKEILYRSLTKLDDQSGHVWQVVLFKQVYPGQAETVNLRLVGFPGSAELLHPQPLKITTATGKVLTAADVFLDEAPAPTIGQYDFKDILPQLSIEPLVLSIPLPSDTINISVPQRVVQDWQKVMNGES
ncbi:conserved hypothetical protein [Trichormus variabilis ATCC 29413]|uniref:DUF3122 domain-containing protein n=4 Tax=Anabaena variabilis TaxID=264691 RepID=Q3M431_TRIV2|nr:MULTISPECIES: DUF3122 domain-containing protein [Nostocaceae]ABA24255.1 conserved hypothetical protein [Trichormus variabilis ATCC 29413]MBC1257319.1 DUF3122 domain-containing protein [Trichormus variabilis V5]MBC1269690.1 DUF3122 domain-containing protein [Trichormus variabilis FSR]MBC1305439.1 DUF3122 domain-containing protein [Trichormus variabilis N2B]MBC1329626.1 DUF3122 domain-containing protein [Trichormus variabilis 9RC]